VDFHLVGTGGQSRTLDHKTHGIHIAVAAQFATILVADDHATDNGTTGIQCATGYQWVRVDVGPDARRAGSELGARTVMDVVHYFAGHVFRRTVLGLGRNGCKYKDHCKGEKLLHGMGRFGFDVGLSTGTIRKGYPRIAHTPHSTR
jgi:hypothetical protein